MSTVLYLCDGQGCKTRWGCRFGECRHTTNPEHAVNGKCEAPWLEPERFNCVDVRSAGRPAERFYVERETCH
jgi:hypothetical protein